MRALGVFGVLSTDPRFRYDGERCGYRITKFGCEFSRFEAILDDGLCTTLAWEAHMAGTVQNLYKYCIKLH